VLAALVVAAILPAAPASASAGASDSARADATRLDRALRSLVHDADGPPGIAAVVQRGRERTLYTAGVGDLAERTPIAGSDYMRLASVSKAFSGAAALSLVAAGTLQLDDTIGKWLPNLPRAWWPVTLRELLQHTSGIPDFSKSPQFTKALGESLLSAPPPTQLLAYAVDEESESIPGTRFHYSNSDNVIVGLMIEAATHASYESELSSRVFAPLGLAHTSLPSSEHIGSPAVRGYEAQPPTPPEDLTELFAAGWTWASGGIVSTPFDANTFVRGYASGANTNAATRTAQFKFIPGSSEPPGPGENSSGLAIFRYRTRCGTVYGHTGNTSGYTQFVAATADGSRSAVVSVNTQITPSVHSRSFPELREIYTLAVCAALAR
jgi:D-alanyl-D-alanine carboxypeptidase